MEILFYQGFIIATLVVVRVFSKNHLELACLVWSGFTLINLFWPPLIVLQLIVVWGTYSLIRPKAAHVVPTGAGSAPAQKLPSNLKSNGRPIEKVAPRSVAAAAPSSGGTHREPLATAEGTVRALGQPSKPPSGGKPATPLPDRPSTSRPKMLQGTEAKRELATFDSVQTIRDIVSTRDIQHLVHFTQADNLVSIFREGLLSVEEARRRGLRPRTNDPVRYDRYLHGISLSVSYPNAPMFYKLRKMHPETDWALLLIDPSVLFEKRCGFCRFNAADRRVPKDSEAALVGAQNFEAMFDRTIEHTPSDLLRPCDPTDPQAEVLAFESIEPSYVQKVIFFHEEVMRCNEDILMGVKKCVDKSWLNSRPYFLRRLPRPREYPSVLLSNVIPRNEIPF